MSRCPLRFIHASDFQLHRPLEGLADVPDEVRAVLLAAPQAAARGVFDAAIANAVDFVLLCGNIIDVQQASPGAARFLVDQLKRLAERKIRVYWAAAGDDAPDKWPAGLPLPEGVHVFAADQVQTKLCQRDGRTVAAIVGTSNGGERIRPGQFSPSREGAFTIAAVAGQVSSDELLKRDIHYWALGGSEQSQTPANQPHVVHYPGTPQGRSPAATGKHGATLVSVDDAGTIRLQALATDAVRWHHERLSATNATSDDELFRLLAERTGQLIGAAADRHLLIRWSLLVNDALSRELARGGMDGELLARLARQFGNRRPLVHTHALAAEAPPHAAAELYEEDTILGDFLRSLRDYQQSPGKRLNFERLLPHDATTQQVRCRLRVDPAGGREQLLREVAALGVHLLAGASLSEAGEAKVRFRGKQGAKPLALKHDGSAWQAQGEMEDMLDEELSA